MDIIVINNELLLITKQKNHMDKKKFNPNIWKLECIN